MADGIVQYRAQDGSDVRLSPAIVARYVVTGNAEADERDVFAFMAKCQARGLNPLAGDAYMTTFQGQSGKSTSVIVSKDYFVRVAQSQPDFDGMQAGVVVVSNGQVQHREGSLVLEGEALVGGWAVVHKRTQTYPSRAEVALSEYNTGKSLWRSKPATMIRKVALVQALREAYPGAFGGIYDGSEMPEPVAPMPEPEPQVAQPVEGNPQVEVEASAEAVEPDSMDF